MPARRTRVLGLVATAIAVSPCALSAWGCRRLLDSGPETSMGDVESNLEQMIAVTSKGLDLEVSPRFLTLGPLPNAAPWDQAVSASLRFQAHGQQLSFKAGRDGLIRERYEARPCPLREIWSCVELWATGKFGKDKQLACVGMRLDKGDTIEKRKLAMRTADNCPFMMTSPSPAQQVVRGLEKAQLEHSARQEADRYLDPKLP